MHPLSQYVIADFDIFVTFSDQKDDFFIPMRENVIVCNVLQTDDQRRLFTNET